MAEIRKNFGDFVALKQGAAEDAQEVSRRKQLIQPLRAYSGVSRKGNMKPERSMNGSIIYIACCRFLTEVKK